ncbi:helix-turn-helix domain-containing protein [Enterobacter hormaechei]|uniref:helix-turn-helix domain-containing protein n=1 Tax=Enterobacter hormaechei TaxID=158836 RepID=UPI00138F8FD4|nr:AraC family transcriptional regulator [Enterobacter hormaechei]
MLKRETFLYESTCSWFAKRLELSEIPLKWHYHQEYELTLTLHSEGKRFIGNHTSAYSTPDLIFIAPNQPHSWASASDTPPSEVFVILIPETWFKRLLLSGMEEYRSINQLFSLASPAIQFSAECAKASEPLFRNITSCKSPLTRLSLLITLFELLLEDKGIEHISERHPLLPYHNQRIEKMLDYIDKNFTMPLTLQQVAEHIHCSISTVKRDMNDFVGLSFSQYLLQMRIKKACFLLRTTTLPLSVIAMQSGFQEVSYFHRQFNILIKETPAKYRRKHTT